MVSLPQPLIPPAPVFVWATVSAVSPLRITLDGDTAALGFTPRSLIDPLVLRVGQRIRCELVGGEPVVLGVNGGAVGYRFMQTVIFTATGSFTKASYPWLRAIRARGVGGGGAGGGLTTGTAVNGRAGGGAGGYSEKFITDIAALAASETITVGTGGTGGTGNGADGVASSAFGMTCNGGVGGIAAPALGGTASGGDINIPGGASGPPSGTGLASVPFAMGSPGGTSLLGAGGTASLSAAAGISGGNGLGYGSGGGGAVRGTTSSAPTGGNGAPGIWILDLYA